jgi:pimeloyl-ACP methyl ester carboxylesterase
VSHAQRRRVFANGLEHHVLEWGESRESTVLLLHGFLDAAATWDRVASALVARGHRVIAPDLRGFGDGARLPAGGYYHFVDYVADVADLVDALVPSDARLSVVGHSMGGTISTLYAGSFPERLVRHATLEGLGPPDNPHSIGPIRMRGWIEDVRKVRARPDPPPLTREEARRRLAVNHANVPPKILDEQLQHLVREVPGGVIWRNDPLHRTRAPMPFFAKLFIEFAKAITCPTLFVSGGPLGYHPPDEEERLATFPKLERVTLEDAGHMMHWTRPGELAAVLAAFVEDEGLLD